MQAIGSVTRISALLFLPLIYTFFIFQIVQRDQNDQKALLRLNANVLAEAMLQNRNSLVEQLENQRIPQIGAFAAPVQPAAIMVFDKQKKQVAGEGQTAEVPLPSLQFQQAVWRGRTVAEVAATEERAFWLIGLLRQAQGKQFAYYIYFPFERSMTSELADRFALKNQEM